SPAVASRSRIHQVPPARPGGPGSEPNYRTGSPHGWRATSASPHRRPLAAGAAPSRPPINPQIVPAAAPTLLAAPLTADQPRKGHATLSGVPLKASHNM